MAKVPFKVSFSSYPDETTELCDLVLPDHHALESWGDAQPVAGVISLQQPAMDPVFDTRATADVLLAVAKGNPKLAARKSGAELSRVAHRALSRWHDRVYRRALKGRLARHAARAHARSARPSRPRAPPRNIDGTQGDIYLVVYPSPLLGDGRGANKPWLQEMPDPVTKVCWQTVVEIASADRGASSAIDARRSCCTVETPRRQRSPRRRTCISAFAATRSRSRSAAVTRAYGRYAQRRRRQCPAICCRWRSTRKSGAQALRRRRRRSVTKTGDSPLVTHRRLRAPARTRHRAGDRRSRELGLVAPRAEEAREARARRRGRRSAHAGRRVARVPARSALAGRARRAGRSRASRRSTRQGDVRSEALERDGEAPLGDDRRSRALHRMLGLRHRVLRREQHPDGRRRTGRTRRSAARWPARREHHARPRDGVDPPRALLRGRRGRQSTRTSRRASCRCSASTAATRRASRCARCTRRTTRRTASTCRSTTAASARATARTTARTRFATSTGSATASRSARSTRSPSR